MSLFELLIECFCRSDLDEDALAIAGTALWDFRDCGPRELHHWALLTLSWLLKQYAFMTLELWKMSHTVTAHGTISANMLVSFLSLISCCLTLTLFSRDLYAVPPTHTPCISTLPGTQTLHMQQLRGCVTQTSGNLLTHSPSGWFIIYKPVTNLHYLYLDMIIAFWHKTSFCSLGWPRIYCSLGCSWTEGNLPSPQIHQWWSYWRESTHLT